MNKSDTDLTCVIVTIGEYGKQFPWRVCNNCGHNIENAPDYCENCGAKVIGYMDIYQRRKTIECQGAENGTVFRRR